MKNYNLTFFGACLCFVTQALVINIYPFFFTTFNLIYGISLTKLALLTTVIFGVQFFVDLIGYKIADSLGYKKSVFMCNGFVVLGLSLMCFLPDIINPFLAIIICIFLTSIGGGLIETITSPMVEALPFEGKSTKMSLLHSFYCWGHLLVILLNTLMVILLPAQLWKICFLIWITIPLVCSAVFIKAPVIQLKADKKSGSIKSLITNKTFLLILIALLCAGAIEQSFAQWSSYFAETTLGLSKTVGDLVSVCGFAVSMAIARTLYGLFGQKINPFISLITCGALAGGCAIIVALQIKALSVVFIALSGFLIGIMWPLIITVPAKVDINGGTKMFSVLALFGDTGCIIGPFVTGFIADNAGFKLGTGTACIYGFILCFTILLVFIKNKKSVSTK